MRTRTKNAQETEPWAYQSVAQSATCPGTPRVVTTTNYSGTGVVSDYTETMHDVVTPRFEALSARGKIINNPMDQTTVRKWVTIYPFTNAYAWRKWNNVCNPDAFVYYNLDSQGTLSSNFIEGDLAPVPTVDVNAMKALAISRVWANVQLTEAQTLVVLAEGKKTVNSLYFIGKRLFRIYNKMRKLGISIKLIKQLTTKELINQYMELRYLIRPLFYDIMDFHKVYKTWTEEIPYRMTFRETERASEKYSDTLENVSTETTICGTWTNKATYLRMSDIDAEVRAGVMVSVVMNHPSLAKLGIGLSDVAPALWELVPFSFVVDWFINVSDVIGSWSPKPGFEVLASWVVVDQITTQSNTCTDYSAVCVPYANYSQCTHIKSGRPSFGSLTHTVVRTPNPSRPILPRFKLRLDTLKLVDLAIILRNIFR